MDRQNQVPSSSPDPRRRLPSVSSVLEHPAIRKLAGLWPHDTVVDAIQQTLDTLRNAARHSTIPDLETIAGDILAIFDQVETQRIRPVINATGILLHTNLGRSVLPREAVTAVSGAWRCVNLELDLETGERGRRHFSCEQLFCKITGAEAAVIVNNNAGATLLILAALCAGKDVLISRGQLVEIGGSYRLPDCIHQSGAHLVEVGTTNKTRLRDYADALSDNTGAILRVTPSNYRIVGFTEMPSIQELARLKRADVLLLDDLGCGALVDLAAYGLPAEPTIQESLRAGADLCCCSADKLIGGPQAGIIAGRKDLVDRVRAHPLFRMLRVGKLTDLALEQTLRLFLQPENLPERHPLYRMLSTSLETLEQRAEKLCQALQTATPDSQIDVVESESAMGGGALPGIPIPSRAVRLYPARMSASEFSRHLRRQEIPVIARIHNDAVWFDMRSLLEEDDAVIGETVRRIYENR